jgi:hypothetical protein
MSKKIYARIDSIIDSKNLLDDIKEIVSEGTKNNATIVSRYSLVKGYIKKNYSDKFTADVLESIKPSEDISDAVFKKANDARTNKKSFIFNKDDIDKIYSLVSSTNIIDSIIYCLFISGRRINEIIKGTFTAIKRKPNYAHFVGMSKLKGRVDAGNDILLLDKFTTFKKLITIIQDKYSKLKIQDITKRTNTRLKKLFNSEWHAHMMRAIYAVYSHHKINKQSININGWITKVLNHGDGNSSINYSYVIYQPSSLVKLDKDGKKEEES